MILEVLKLLASIVTPVTVILVGYVLNQRLKSIDEAQWQSRKIIEKRLELYDEIAPEMNKVYCFCMFLGYWKDISPTCMLIAKRTLDKQVNIYRHLLPEDFYEKYNRFIHNVFETYTGHGLDAKLKAPIANIMGNRKEHRNYDWESDFDLLFQESSGFSANELNRDYLDAMNALRDCIGLAAKGGPR